MNKRNHEPGKLAAIALKRLGDGWHADGGNLYLFVRGTSRTWVFRYTAPNGRRRNMGLGSLDAISLARARELAKQYRATTKDKQTPCDPIAIAQEEKSKRQETVAKKISFRQCAEAYIKANRAGWKNAKHVQQWENTLEKYAYPTLGELAVSAIDTSLVTKCLVDIWTEKTETATRVRGRIESVLDWAKVSGFRQGENPARWRGHLDKVFPAATKVAKVKHHPALPFTEIGSFMTKLRAREGLGARALELTILTAARSGEVRGARWSEINLDEKIWVIPAERMKAGKEHRIPLAAPAVALLKELTLSEDEDLVFLSAKPGKPISDMTLGAVLKRMDCTAITTHGFRSTFRDWCSEKTTYPNEVVEMALAHTIKNSTEAAYRRGDMLEKRRALMNDWAKYCEHITQPATVINIDSRKYL
jgi:integrase